MKIKFSSSLAGLPTIDYRILKPFQGELKKLSSTNYKKLKKSMKDKGFFAPLFVWIDPMSGESFVMDGHQRLSVLITEKVTPFEIPYIQIHAETRKEAAEKLLLITSQFGETTEEGFNWFKAQYEIEASFFVEMTTFEHFLDDVELDGLKDSNLSKFMIGGDTTAAAPEQAPKPFTKTSTDYASFELVMLFENKKVLVQVLNDVKQEKGFDKNEDALMFIINHFKNS